MVSSSSLIVICFFSLEAYGFFFDLEKSYLSRMSKALVFTPLSATCLTGRDNSNCVLSFPIAMAYNEKSKLRTQPQEDKAIFLFGVVRISNNTRILIEKCCLCFCERNTMLLPVRHILPAVPFEFQPIHGIILLLYCIYSQGVTVIGFDAHNAWHELRAKVARPLPFSLQKA